jgi:hypothetical protein
VTGIPLDVDGAKRLFAEDPHEFQLWALTLVDGQPRDGGKRGADRGVDGIVYYQEDAKTIGQAVISVKGGENIAPTDVRDLIGTMNNQSAKLGVFITLHEPSERMKQAARDAGSVEAGGRLRPRVQIRTIERLLDREHRDRPDLPPIYDIISSAAAARRATQTRRTLPPTSEEIRREPQMPLPIKGGRSKDKQQPLPLEEPSLTSPTKKGRGKRAS